MQKEYIYPALGNRMSPKEWNEAGRPDIVERATRARSGDPHRPTIPNTSRATIDDLIRAKHDIKLPREMMEPGDPRWSKAKAG